MQGSRFGRLGKESLKNRTNFTLMQQINPQQFLNDRPLKNTSTLYLDENGKQTQLSQLKSSSFRAKDNQKFFAEQQSHDMEQSNMKDLYALPVVHSSAFSQVGNKSKFNKKLIKSQYMTQRPALDSIRQVNNSDVYNRTEKQKNRHKLLSIKRPKGFLKKGEKFEDIDFIGDNLYEVEDIISDISKIMDHTKQKNIVAASAQPKNPIKNSKWLNNHFGGLNKLDEMLLNYKSFSDESPSIPILENFYRQQKSTEQKKQKPLFKGKMNSFNFPSNSKNSNEYKLSLVVIKWNQMPMIPIKWQADVFLKLQSYPQQEEYRKVVLKAYSTKLRSYSIFLQESAGIVSGKGRINDKNIGKKRLMSEQQYAKAWEQKYPENDNTLNEEQKQILMQFDIEWYRTIIELCYHSGLQDLLEKEYEVQTYVEVMNSLEREEVSVENIIKNQMKYLLQYFIEVYSYGNNQTTMGIIRINNDQNMKIEEVRSNFNNLLNADNGSDNQIQFCVWPLKEDKSSLVVIVQLCGKTSNEYIQMHRNQKIRINMKQPLCTIEMMGEGMMKKNQKQKLQQKQQERQEQEQEKMQNNKINKLIIKNKQDNDWDIYMKIQNHQTNTSQLKITMAQQLLFGLLYRVAS